VLNGESSQSFGHQISAGTSRALRLKRCSWIITSIEEPRAVTVGHRKIHKERDLMKGPKTERANPAGVREAGDTAGCCGGLARVRRSAGCTAINRLAGEQAAEPAAKSCGCAEPASTVSSFLSCCGYWFKHKAKLRRRLCNQCDQQLWSQLYKSVQPV